MTNSPPDLGALHRPEGRAGSPPMDADARSEEARRAALHAFFDTLHAEPWSHHFYALLRHVDALSPASPRFGRALRVSQEAIRLGQDAELDFAPAAVSSFDQEGGTAPRLGVRLFGLLGPQGPLPTHLTEFVRERQRFRNDPTAARFLDVFHHRLLALFYRAWADTQPTVQHDRPSDDRFSVWLGAAAGLGGTVPAVDTAPLTRAAQLHQTGLLACRSRHPEGLAKLLAQAFGVPVRIETHVLHWLAIEPEDRSGLGFAAGRPGARAGEPAVLGRNASAGQRVRDRQHKFRVVLGPLSHAAYGAFLPDGAAWPALRDWIRQYAGFNLRWDLALCIAEAAVPEPTLASQRRLGIDAWLGQRRLGDLCALRVRPDTSFLLTPHHRRKSRAGAPPA